jgi:hypothetical protein
LEPVWYLHHFTSSIIDLLLGHAGNSINQPTIGIYLRSQDGQLGEKTCEATKLVFSMFSICFFVTTKKLMKNRREIWNEPSAFDPQFTHKIWYNPI